MTFGAIVSNKSERNRTEILGEVGKDRPSLIAFTQLLADRYACRAYRSDPVPTELIVRVVSTAQLTASWCNSQPWQIIVTSAAATQRLVTALQEEQERDPEAHTDVPFPVAYNGIYADRRRDCGRQLYESVGIERGDREASVRQGNENFRLFGAPHLALVTTPRDLGAYGIFDCGGFLANFLSAARALGIDTTPQAALAVRSDFLRRYFGVADDRLILCGIAFGYADNGHRANAFRTPRAACEDVLCFVA